MSFFGSLFGSDQRKDLRRANKEATQHITEGLEQGVAAYEQGRARLDPYSQTGGQANAMLAAALGLSGADAQREFLANYQADPTQDLQQQAVARAMAARGLTDSGASRLASARVWNEGYQNHLNRMMNLGTQGMQAAGQQGQFDAGIGDMRFGTGQLRANQAVNFGNAMAESRNIGINNLLGIAGLGLKASGIGGFGVPGR